MDHLDDLTAQDYVADRLSDERRLSADQHLAGCGNCLKHIRSLFHLCDHFDTVWNSWSAIEHGRVYRQWRLVAALVETGAAAPSVFQRAGQQLSQWLEDVAAGLAVGVNVLVDHSRKIACLAAGEMRPGYEFELCPVRAGVGSPQELARLDEHVREGSALLARQRTQEAVDELLAAQRIDIRAVQGAVLDVFREGKPLFRVVADSFRGRAAVKCMAEDRRVPAFAILLPLEGERQALTARFQPMESDPSWIAEFEGVGDGAYWLVLGPAIAI